MLPPNMARVTVIYDFRTDLTRVKTMCFSPTKRGAMPPFLGSCFPGLPELVTPFKYIVTEPHSSCRSTPRHWCYGGGPMRYQVPYGSPLSLSEVRLLSLSA